MAKKTRRPRKNSNDAAVEDTMTEDLAKSYRYVVDDLTRIGIIAAVLIGGLVALSLFL